MRYALFFLLWPGLLWAQQSQPSLCGNNIKDVGEFCDDGNQVDGDGCTATCRLERCGDGLINNAGKEECDDGNQLSDDGCSAGCHMEKAPASGSNGGGSVSPTLIDADEAFRRSLVVSLFGPPGLGLVYGPSLAHFAAGETGRGVGMVLLRTTLLGSAIGIGTAMTRGNIEAGLGGALLGVDGAIFYGLVIADLLDGPHAIERAKKAKAP